MPTDKDKFNRDIRQQLIDMGFEDEDVEEAIEESLTVTLFQKCSPIKVKKKKKKGTRFRRVCKPFTSIENEKESMNDCEMTTENMFMYCVYICLLDNRSNKSNVLMNNINDTICKLLFSIQSKQFYVGMDVWVWTTEKREWAAGKVVSITKQLISIIFNGNDFRWVENDSDHFTTTRQK
ncbi:hypothetical protein RFI_25574, partial [Reticulomyxa filosa]